jgi:hypothetical protein
MLVAVAVLLLLEQMLQGVLLVMVELVQHLQLQAHL